GTELAVEEWQHQFHSHWWNCSTLQGLQVFGKVTIQGGETPPFSTALSSSGAPSRASLSSSHGHFLSAGFQWSGCSDNLLYRIAFSQAFVDNPERSCGVSSIPALMNLHNNEAGRKLPSAPQALLSHMKVGYQCHGVSGSCEVCTCWKVMPPFCKVGNILKEKFEGVMEVHTKRVCSCKLLVPKSSPFKPYTAHDLVYLLASPDFCNWDPRHRVFGTYGRGCNQT
ncbi:WNT4 protein, partial [Glaucidium brasilianum]|nr:WNT4 protein [Glaucidium brasilianum]